MVLLETFKFIFATLNVTKTLVYGFRKKKYYSNDWPRNKRENFKICYLHYDPCTYVEFEVDVLMRLGHHSPTLFVLNNTL